MALLAHEGLRGIEPLTQFSFFPKPHAESMSDVGGWALDAARLQMTI